MVRGVRGLENSGRVAVLPPGMDVKTFSIPLRDAQFLEGAPGRPEIARLYKVPPYLIGDPSGKTSTYASAEQGDIVYGKHCLTPIARRIEQKLDMTVLGSQDALTCRHDLGDIMRGDVASQAEADASDVLNGIKTRDECRSKRGLNPMGGNAAKLMVKCRRCRLKTPDNMPTGHGSICGVPEVIALLQRAVSSRSIGHSSVPRRFSLVEKHRALRTGGENRKGIR